MPEPIMEPTTMAVELKRPIDWINWGPLGCGLLGCGLLGTEVGRFDFWDWEAVGIVTWIGFTGFGWKSLLLSLPSLLEAFHPALELLRRVVAAEDRRRNRD